jgi:hypothetical protein
MPKITDEEIKEDFLEVDKPIPGQNYCCLSFVSPDKVIDRKEKFMFYHYQKERLNNYKKLFSDSFDALVSEQEDGMVELSRLFDMKKSLDKLFEVDNIEYTDFKEKYDDFLFKDERKVCEIFDNSNDFKTSVRGVKVRGIYDSRREAEMRAKTLQHMDQNFNIFVGQVGYWLPWDPESNNIEDQEYMNEELNELVKEKKKNEDKKNMFYEDQKIKRMSEASTAADRLRDKLQKKKELEETAQQVAIEDGEDGTSKVSSDELQTTDTSSVKDTLDSDKLSQLTNNISIELGETEPAELGGDSKFSEALKEFNSEDPWLSRKKEEE